MGLQIGLLCLLCSKTTQIIYLKVKMILKFSSLQMITYVYQITIIFERRRYFSCLALSRCSIICIDQLILVVFLKKPLLVRKKVKNAHSVLLTIFFA